VLELAVASGAYASRGEAPRGIEHGAYSVNDQRVGDPSAAPPPPIADEFYVLRTGKKRYLVGRRKAG
jgi:tyrosyl-tRNA synthetase